MRYQLNAKSFFGNFFVENCMMLCHCNFMVAFLFQTIMPFSHIRPQNSKTLLQQRAYGFQVFYHLSGVVWSLVFSEHIIFSIQPECMTIYLCNKWQQCQ